MTTCVGVFFGLKTVAAGDDEQEGKPDGDS